VDSIRRCAVIPQRGRLRLVEVIQAFGTARQPALFLRRQDHGGQFVQHSRMLRMSACCRIVRRERRGRSGGSGGSDGGGLTSFSCHSYGIHSSSCSFCADVHIFVLKSLIDPLPSLSSSICLSAWRMKGAWERAMTHLEGPAGETGGGRQSRTGLPRCFIRFAGPTGAHVVEILQRRA
jgi:hypothetical protein